MLIFNSKNNFYKLYQIDRIYFKFYIQFSVIIPLCKFSFQYLLEFY
jgi:hypothetical protein